MSKYDPLRQFLESRSAEQVPMTFADVERVLGFPLPPSAKAHPTWWSNNTGTHVGVRAWRDAGWKTSRVDVPGEKVVFVRAKGTEFVPVFGSSRTVFTCFQYPQPSSNKVVVVSPPAFTPGG